MDEQALEDLESSNTKLLMNGVIVWKLCMGESRES